MRARPGSRPLGPVLDTDRTRTLRAVAGWLPLFVLAAGAGGLARQVPARTSPASAGTPILNGAHAVLIDNAGPSPGATTQQLHDPASFTVRTPLTITRLVFRPARARVDAFTARVMVTMALAPHAALAAVSTFASNMDPASTVVVHRPQDVRFPTVTDRSWSIVRVTLVHDLGSPSATQGFVDPARGIVLGLNGSAAASAATAPCLESDGGWAFRPMRKRPRPRRCSGSMNHEPPRRPSRMHGGTWRGSVLLLALAACADVDVAKPGASGTDDSPAGGLFHRHCAACHGGHGHGDGPLAPYLSPPPRAFSSGVFSLVSTDNAIPTDEDLMASIQGGMPGTGMPSFAWLPPAQIRELARHVRRLGVASYVRDVTAMCEHDEIPVDPVALRKRAEASLTPGRVFAPLPEAAPTPEVLERGKSLYLIACAACHGVDGRGHLLNPELRGRFDLRLPRDLTSELLRGGASAAAIQHRIEAGMPASGMPPARIAARELPALVAYVRSLIPDAEKNRPEPRPVRIVAGRVAEIPASPADAAWQTAPVFMWPLRTKADVILTAEIAALHDGRDLGLLVRWPDRTQDTTLASGPLPDAVAVQLTDMPEPPFLAMGSAEATVQIWQWQAFVPRDVIGFLDLIDSPLRKKSDASPGIAARVKPRAVAGAGGGQPSMPAFADGGKPISVHQSFAANSWNVIFRRPLAAREAREISLVPGGSFRIAAAIWNGSAGQHGPDKSITGWHELVLAR